MECLKDAWKKGDHKKSCSAPNKEGVDECKQPMTPGVLELLSNLKIGKYIF